MAPSHLNPALLLSALLLLAGSVRCAPEIFFRPYYLQLVRKNYCGGGKHLLSFSDTTACGRGEPVLRHPLKNRTAPLSAWKIKLIGDDDKGVYLASLYPLPPNGTGPACKGVALTVTKPNLCLTGDQANAVTVTGLGLQNPRIWTFIQSPDTGDDYLIASRKRGQTCYRYLGASGDCDDPHPRLYESDDGKGTQRWVLVSLKAPRPPTVTGGLGPDVAQKYPFAWTVSWKEGAKRLQPSEDETYSLVCVNPGQSCTAQPVATLDGIPRGTRRGVLQLPPGTQADCFVVAMSVYFGPICSKPVSVTTPPVSEYPAPEISWIPSDTYINVTLVGGSVYSLPGVEEKYHISYGDESKKVVLSRSNPTAVLDGLKPVTTYKGHVSLEHPFIQCSDYFWSVTTTELNAKPLGATNLQLINPAPDDFTIAWDDGTEGYFKYYLKCVAPGTGCQTKLDKDMIIVNRGVQRYSTSDLKPGTAYDCYVVAGSRYHSICSEALRVTTLAEHRLPSAPMNLGGTVTPIFWEATWEDAKDAGYPKEVYQPFCHPAAAGSCSSRCDCPVNAGISNSTVAEGTRKAIVFDLLPDTQYNCYVRAENSAGGGRVCSEAYSVKTPAMPPPRPPSPPALTNRGSSESTIRWNDSITYALPKIETYTIVAFPWADDPWREEKGQVNVSCLAFNESFIIKRGIPRGVQEFPLRQIAYGRSIYVVAQAEGHCDAVSDRFYYYFVSPPVATCGIPPHLHHIWCAAPEYSKNATAVYLSYYPSQGPVNPGIGCDLQHLTNEPVVPRWEESRDRPGLIQGVPRLKGDIFCGYVARPLHQCCCGNYVDDFKITVNF